MSLADERFPPSETGPLQHLPTSGLVEQAWGTGKVIVGGKGREEKGVGRGREREGRGKEEGWSIGERGWKGEGVGKMRREGRMSGGLMNGAS